MTGRRRSSEIYVSFAMMPQVYSIRRFRQKFVPSAKAISMPQFWSPYWASLEMRVVNWSAKAATALVDDDDDGDDDTGRMYSMESAWPKLYDPIVTRVASVSCNNTIISFRGNGKASMVTMVPPLDGNMPMTLHKMRVLLFMCACSNTRGIRFVACARAYVHHDGTDCHSH